MAARRRRQTWRHLVLGLLLLWRCWNGTAHQRRWRLGSSGSSRLRRTRQRGAKGETRLSRPIRITPRHFASLLPLLRGGATGATGRGRAGGPPPASVADDDGSPRILVVGSAHWDTTLTVPRLPGVGETVTTVGSPTSCAGGKGANQAVGAARALGKTKTKTKTKTTSDGVVRFAASVGSDEMGRKLKAQFETEGVDASRVVVVDETSVPSGQGYVVCEQKSGAVLSIVVRGANKAWQKSRLAPEIVADEVDDVDAIMLQREIPKEANAIYAAAAREAGAVVFLDAGGEIAPLDGEEWVADVDWLAPNLAELAALAKCERRSLDSDAGVVAAARSLQRDLRVRHVLVTLGDRGSVAVLDDGATVLRVQAAKLPTGASVVDETAAGDAYRAFFAVELLTLAKQNRVFRSPWPPRRHRTDRDAVLRAMRVASCAGALACSKRGAMPSLPDRAAVVDLLAKQDKSATDKAFSTPRGGGALAKEENWVARLEETRGGGGWVIGGNKNKRGRRDNQGSTTEDKPTPKNATCPWRFASRLNSMRDRRDLARPDEPDDVLGWIRRQGRARGLDLVDLNYPQHLAGTTPSAVRDALRDANLKCGAVCLRYPYPEFGLGAFTNPDADARRRAVDLARQAADWARDLGAAQVVLWNQQDGYDYPCQVDYVTVWQHVVDCCRDLCDACPDLRISLEYKPTDERTRYYAVPSAGAAVLLARDVDRANFGLTIDLGHCLSALENPAQALALAGAARRGAGGVGGAGNVTETAAGPGTPPGPGPGLLFGVQLNDMSRPATEDGLAFGSNHPLVALEVVWWLRKLHFDGHIYFDTFPRNEDPVRECEFNIRRVKRLYELAADLEDAGLDALIERHDAMGVLELLERKGFL